jgi:alkylation response protein AidB-like acyl-CoA dehydrogenase
MDIVGSGAYLEEGTTGALLAGKLERAYRANTIFTFGGGTKEVQRDIIAMIGLGIPRAPR